MYSKRIFTGILVFMMYFTSGYCTPVDSALENSAKRNAQFSYDIYSRILQKVPGKNVVVGPYSINTALTLAYLGASGAVADEFVPVLRLPSKDKHVVSSTYKSVADSYQNNKNLKVANKIFVGSSYEILPNYKELVENSFHAKIDKINFGNKNEASHTINKWVQDETNQKIKEIISADNLDSDLSVFLANAVYFKGEWTHHFDESLTKKENFFREPNHPVEVDMMYQGPVSFDSPLFKFGEFNDLGVSVVELPYKDSDFSMMVILPNSDKTITEIEKHLIGEDFLDISKNLKTDYVDLKMPKFKIEFDIELNNVLQEMGLKKAFNEGIDEMVNVRSKISKVVHKAFIEVDETKTEASASTGIGITPMMAIMPKMFKADRPFIYVIRDSRTIQFIGRYCASEKV